MIPNILRVLFVVNVPDFGIGQAGIFTYRQLLSLKKIENIEIKSIDLPVCKSKLISYLKFSIMIRKMSGEHDIIHAHHSFAIIICWIFKKRSSKLVGTFLSDSENNFRFRIKLLNKILYYFTQMICDYVVVKNDQSVIWPNKCIVLGNPVNTDKFQIKNKLTCKKKIGLNNKKILGIVISGDVNRPEKNFTEYQEIISKLQNEYSPLVINNITPGAICDYINCCDFIIVPSLFEGSPNAVKEALACGVPVVSRDVGDVKKLLSSLECCHVYYDPTEIDMYLLTKLSSKLDRSTLRERVANFYGTEAEVASKLAQIYQEIL